MTRGDRRLARWIWVAGLLATAGPGCAEEFGPERFETTRIDGTITVDGRPVGSGWIEFVPTDGTKGNLVTSPIGRDGSYSVDGVAVGRVGVGLTAVPGPPIVTGYRPFQLKEFRFQWTPIRREIPPGPRHLVDIDLAAEARAARRPARPDPGPETPEARP